MAKEISNEFTSYDDYYYDGNSDMLIPVSTVVLAEDVMFEDGSNLEEQIEYLKTYGADVKARVASAVSRLTTFTSSDATWDEIMTKLRNASKYIALSKTFNFIGDVQVFTVDISGTYKIECVGAQGDIGSKGSIIIGNVSLEAKDILNIYIGGQNGYNGGGKAVRQSKYGTVDKFNHTCGQGNSISSVGITSYAYGYNGGGATDIRLNGTSLSDRIIVAGGGAGGGKTNNASNSGNNSEKGNSILGMGDSASVVLGSIVQDNGTYSCPNGSVYKNVAMGGHVSGGSAIGGGGGGYYGGVAGYAGTSYASNNFSDLTITNDANIGNGYVKITLIN